MKQIEEEIENRNIPIIIKEIRLKLSKLLQRKHSPLVNSTKHVKKKINNNSSQILLKIEERNVLMFYFMRPVLT